MTFFTGVALVELVLGSFVLAEVVGTRAISFSGTLNLLPAAGLCMFLGTQGWEYFRRVYERQQPVQLKDGMAESLPAAESLLRASCEPAGWQKALLLRVAFSELKVSPDE